MKCPLCQEENIKIQELSGERLDTLLYNLTAKYNDKNQKYHWVYTSPIIKNKYVKKSPGTDLK